MLLSLRKIIATIKKTASITEAMIGHAIIAGIPLLNNTGNTTLNPINASALGIKTG